LEIQQYIDLIDSFVSVKIDAPRFESGYLALFKKDKVRHSERVFTILNELFYAVDDYVENPDLREGPSDLDDEQLRERAGVALRQLLELDDE